MNKRSYYFDFIPYESIGPIKINKKVDEKNSLQQNIKWLEETSTNYVICRVLILDNPEEIRRNDVNHDYIYLKYNEKVIELTCYFDKFINNLRNVCNDIQIIENSDYTYIYSDTLGIIAIAEVFKEFENKKLIRLVAFNGKDEYKKIKNNYFTFDNEETEKEYQKYLDEINNYNEKTARGENPNTDMNELTKKFKDKFALLDNNGNEINIEPKEERIAFDDEKLVKDIDNSINNVDEKINNTISDMINSYLNLYNEEENQIAINLFKNYFKNEFCFLFGSITGIKHRLYIYIDNNKARFIDNGIIKTIPLSESKLNEIKNVIIDNKFDRNTYEELKNIYDKMSELDTGIKTVYEIHINGIHISIPYALNTSWGKNLLLKIYELL